MFYCEGCNLLSEKDSCGVCGRKGLRPPIDSDYCFLIELNQFYGGIFMGILDSEGVPFVDFPSGSGVRTVFAMKLENVKIFVPYEHLDRARDIYAQTIANDENPKRDIANNLDKLFMQASTAKKARKRFKMPESESIVEYCAEKMLNADSVVNRGRIISCPKGGMYWFVYCGKDTFILNSVTYEILSAERKK